MIKSRRKIFKESLSSVRNEIRDMFEDIKDGLESARNDGVGVLDVNVVVQTWDQGAPVLVKGAYNYYSGDINVDGNEFIDDFDSLFGEYMKKFDDEVKERNDMLDDILNKMWDDVENGDLDEEEYQEEQMRLMDDTCTWSISIDLNRTGGGLLSSMAVSIESGDADVLDRDTRSVDEVEKWCKKKSESRIMRESRVARRRNSLRKVLENKKFNCKKEAKGKFIRTINPNATDREKTVTLSDLGVNPDIEYIGLFVNGYDVDGLDRVSWTKPMWGQLETLMKQLDNELLEIKGKPNKKIEADIYLCDEDNNNEVTVNIPTIETDRFGNIVFDDSKGYPRKVRTLEDLCLIAFHKMLKNM